MTRRPAPALLLTVLLLPVLLSACAPLPDPGGPSVAAPPPPLLPLDEMLNAPLPEATPAAAAALAARGEALRAEAAGL